MDWIQEAQRLFNRPKPAHFTNYRHCCECAEHDAVLTASDVNAIGLEQLGNPGWDPLCFTSAEGLLYYMPALIRLTLETMATPQEQYLEQLLFHLIYDSTENRIVRACNPEQRAFIAGFLAYLMEQYSVEIDECGCGDDMLTAYEIWST
jgi:hypothetical protein